jgi:hypothetical protein
MDGETPCHHTGTAAGQWLEAHLFVDINGRNVFAHVLRLPLVPGHHRVVNVKGLLWITAPPPEQPRLSRFTSVPPPDESDNQLFESLLQLSVPPSKTTALHTFPSDK